MDEVTFRLVGLLFTGWSMLLLAYAGFWKRRAGRVYYHAAAQASDDKEKKELAMRGVLAGNKDAARLYAVMQPDEFSTRHPDKAFKRKGVRCVFHRFYYPKRYEIYLSFEQACACKDVLDFKDGQADGVDFFSSGIAKLNPNPGTVILFMPCSAGWKYWRRFKGISDHIKNQCPDLTSGISYLKYTGHTDGKELRVDRESERQGNHHRGRPSDDWQKSESL